MFRSIWKGRNLHSRRIVTIWRFIWVMALLLGEWLVFRLSAAKCHWPSSQSSPVASQYPQRVLLIADPQVTDAYSYERTGFLLWATEFYSDLYMQRSYRHVTSSMNPDKIVFLGDLMDGGWQWNDQGFKTQLDRFYRIFNKQSTIPTLYMSGNHDIGIRDGIQPEVFQRFQAQFGPTSLLHPLAYNHTMVLLDTAALTNTNPRTKTMIQQEALDVMNEMMMKDDHPPQQQRALLTHVPLYRPDQTSCGPLRVQSRPSIYQNYGFQYQNMMNADVSHAILQSVQPDVVFSGDDHDFCQVTHAYSSSDDDGRQQQQQLAIEYTVPTFSMAQGVRLPGFMLLQATPNKLVPQLCWLPDQLGIFIKYGILVGLTIVTIFGRYLWMRYYYGSLAVENRKKILSIKHKKEEDIEEQLVDPFVGGNSKELGLSPISKASLSASSTASVVSIGSCLHDIKDIAVVAIPFYVICVLFL